jgi:hypothetical protein
MADDSETAVQAPAEATGAAQDADTRKIARYAEEIELYDKETAKWGRQAKRIAKRYKDERGGDGTVESQERRYNILWANIQNLKPILWARNPKPDIQRRFKDADPVGRVTSDVLERAVSFFTETDHFYDTNQQCVLDYLLSGRGTVWLRYVPHFKAAPQMAAADPQVTDDVGPGDENQGQAEAPQVIDYEEVIPDYVHREDFGHNICRTWDETWLVWRIVYLSRAELRERFVNLSEDEILAIPLDYKKQDSTGRVIDDGVSKAVVYEAWDKIRRCAVWFHKAVPEALDYRPDPLRLDGFFPTPKPLFTNLANDSLIPVPDYVEYQDQAAELDLLTARIAMMTKCLKVVGVYDASVEGLNRMFNEGTENELIPVQQWALFAEKGGMDGAMTILDIKMIAEALLACYEARDKVKQDLDQITGMADIVRGETDPNETASAQKLKAGYASQRMSDRQREVQMFARQTIRIMVNIICEHFQPETIKAISGVRLLTAQEKQMYSAPSPMMGHNGGPPMAGMAQPPMPGMAPAQPPAPPPLPPNVTPDQMQDMLTAPTWEDVIGLIQNNAMRSFRIDIETDSTIKADEQQDRADTTQMITSLGELLDKGMKAGEQDPDIIPLMGQVMQFALRRFPVGKELEATLSTYIQKKEKEAANPQPKPNPEMAKVQGEMQLSQQKMQADQQAQQAKMQSDMQLAREKAALDTQTAQSQQAAQDAQDAREQERQAQREQAKLMMEERIAMQRIAAETDRALRIAHIDAASRIEVARITAKASDGAKAEAREESGE